MYLQRKPQSGAGQKAAFQVFFRLFYADISRNSWCRRRSAGKSRALRTRRGTREYAAAFAATCLGQRSGSIGLTPNCSPPTGWLKITRIRRNLPWEGTRIRKQTSSEEGEIAFAPWQAAHPDRQDHRRDGGQRGGFTVMWMGADVAGAPAASVAFAVIVKEPPVSWCQRVFQPSEPSVS
jgi:hypothetical protein